MAIKKNRPSRDTHRDARPDRSPRSDNRSDKRSDKRSDNKARPPRRDHQPNDSQSHSQIRSEPRSDGPVLGKNCYLMFGKHPVEAALQNPRREKMRLWLTSAGRETLGDILQDHSDISVQMVESDTLASMIHSDSPHQGMAMEVRRLGTVHLEEACKVEDGAPNIVLALDQVTDPHNIGAIMRSAIAFGAKAIITPDRHAPPETGVLAKSAAGMLELLPWVRVTNLGNALEELAEAGYWRVGLDGDAKQELSTIDAGQNVVLVLGSEGKGMREGTQKKCDFMAKLPINPKIESLNVSNAAAVALYELCRK